MSYRDDPTFVALYAGVCAAPADRTAQLVFADYAQGADAAELNVWAEFIRAQHERAGYGPPRYVLEMGRLSQQAGAGYFTTLVDRATPLAVDQRVDVKRTDAGRTPGRDPFLAHGLRVSRLQPEDDQVARVHLTRDELSVPYPQDRVDALRREEDRLLVWNWQTFASGLLGVTPRGARHWTLELGGRDEQLLPYLCCSYASRDEPPQVAGPSDLWGFHGGFPAAVTLQWEHWRRSGDQLVKAFPVSRVTLRDPPVLDERHDPDNRRTQFRLLGVDKTPVVYRGHSSWHGTPGALRAAMTRQLLEKRWPAVGTWDFPNP